MEFGEIPLYYDDEMPGTDSSDANKGGSTTRAASAHCVVRQASGSNLRTDSALASTAPCPKIMGCSSPWCQSGSRSR